MNALIIYFSATGTTKKIVKAFANGLDCDVTFCDITRPESRGNAVIINHDLVVIAVPIYGERIPGFINDYLKKIDGAGRPLVTISVYGNVGFGISLTQFAEHARARNFKYIGAGTFIGEHTYAKESIPVALGRPDEKDLLQSNSFGMEIRKKFDTGLLNPIAVRKSRLPKLITKFPDSGTRFLIKKPIIDESLCNRCKVCTIKCPMGAIDSETLEIDEKKCLRCYACVKGCPKSARTAQFRVLLFGRVFKSMGRKSKNNEIII